MGLLNLVAPQLSETPFGKFMDNTQARRAALGGGLMQGTSLGGGLAAAGQMLPQASMLDQQQMQTRSAEAERQAQLNQTMEWMREQSANNPQIAQIMQGLEMGVLDPGDAFNSTLRILNPQASGDPFTLSPGEVRHAGDGSVIAQGPQEPAPRPMNAQERAMWGIPETDTTPYYLDQNGNPKPLGGTPLVQNNIGPNGQQFPTPPFGQDYRRAPDGTVLLNEQGLPEIVQIPGGPPAIEAEQAAIAGEEQKRAGTIGAVEGASRMLGDVGSIKDLFETTPHWRIVGTFSRPEAAISNTPAGQVRSLVRSLQSGVALGAITRLKEASSTGATGFGSMNAQELDLLLNDIGALDPDTTDPVIFLETIERIDRNFSRIIEQVRATVPPEQIREWGLGELLGGNIGKLGTTTPGNVTSTGIPWSINP